MKVRDCSGVSSSKRKSVQDEYHFHGVGVDLFCLVPGGALLKVIVGCGVAWV